MAITVTTEWNGQPVAEDIDRRAQSALTAAGQAGENIAQGLARVRTGFMRESVYVQVASFPGGWLLILGDSAAYAIYNELGTIHMSAQPFVRPGGDAAAEALPELLARGG